MRLVIDGRRLTAERTGVGRYLELLLQDWATSGAPLPETLIVLRERGGLSRVPLGLGNAGRSRRRTLAGLALGAVRAGSTTPTR